MTATETNLGFSKSFPLKQLPKPHFKVWLLPWPLGLSPVSPASQFPPTWVGGYYLSINIPVLLHLLQKGDQDWIRDKKYLSEKNMSFDRDSPILNPVYAQVRRRGRKLGYSKNWSSKILFSDSTIIILDSMPNFQTLSSSFMYIMKPFFSIQTNLQFITWEQESESLPYIANVSKIC